MPELIHHDDILEIRLNHPPANALDPATVSSLTRLLRESPAKGVKAIVISGAPKMFCAGLDVPHLQKLTRPELSQFWVSFFAMLRALAECKVPLAAAVTGHAPAGGTVLAAFCDYGVMAQGNFQMGFNEVRVGLPLPYPIYIAFERRCGTRIAARYATEGRILDAQHALEIGLVDELASLDQVIPQALAWCRQVAALPPHAVAKTREYVRRSLVEAFDHGWAVDPEQMTRHWHSPETQGAIAKLMAKIGK